MNNELVKDFGARGCGLFGKYGTNLSTHLQKSLLFETFKGCHSAHGKFVPLLPSKLPIPKL
jgi:hypothetical protein